MIPGVKKIVLLSFILAFLCLVLFSFYTYRNLQQSLQTSNENIMELSYLKQLEILNAHKIALDKNIVAAFDGPRSLLTENSLVDQRKKIMDSIRILNGLIQEKENKSQRRLINLEKETSLRALNVFLICSCMLGFFFAAFYFAVIKIIPDKKKTINAIKENEEGYRKLFENNPLPMMICEKETLKFLDVNDAGLEQYGYSREEFLSLGIMDIQPEDNRELLFEKYKYVMTPNKSKPVAKHKKKDGSFVDVQIVYRDIFFRGSNASLVLTNDITAMLKTQEENNRLATVLENTSDFVTLMDLDQRTIFANKAARKVLKYKDSDDLSHKKFLDCLPAKSKTYFTDNIFPVAFVQGVWRGEDVWINNEQKKIPVSQVILVEKPKNGMSGFIASISRDISEAQNKELEIKQMNEQLRALAASLQNIREEERSNIAREIHDDLGQQLTAIKIDVSWIEKQIQGNKEVSEKLKNIILMLNDTVKSIRRISTQLRPSILDDLGLIEALKWQAEEFQKRYGIAIHFVCSKERLVLDSGIATGLFRIFQEAFTNIARHANATLVEVSLGIVDQEIALRIQDNGKGFERPEARTQKTLGLLGMKERALMMGGSFEINNSPGKGVIILINVPLKNLE